MVKSYQWGGWGGDGPCDYCVTPVPIGLGFLFGTALGLGLMGLDLGLGLDNLNFKFIHYQSPVLFLILNFT